MGSRMYKEEFDEYNKGYEEVEEKDMPIRYAQKKEFVDKYVYPAIHHAGDDWTTIEYRLYRYGDTFREAVIIRAYAEAEGRYIYVTGDSKTYIMYEILKDIIF